MNQPSGNTFEQLLVNGSIPEALQLRADSLEAIAKTYQIDVESAKTSTGLLALAGIILSASPLVGLMGGVGALAYGWILLLDYQKTKRLCPVPCLRRGMSELIQGAGAIGLEGADGEDPIRDVIAFLEPPMAHEYELLFEAEGAIGAYLAKLPADRRLEAYRFICRFTRMHNLQLPHVNQIEAYLAGEDPNTVAVPSEAVPQSNALPPAQASASNDTGKNPLHIEVAPQIDVHNYMGKSGNTLRSASPAQSERRIEPPDLRDYPDVKQRMQVLLKAMAESGFPMGKLMNQPFVWCWGRSQSGKTTIALMLAIARIALGHKVGYFTTDDDYPRDVRWSRVEDSPEGYAVALDQVRETLSSAGKGALAGHSWLFDELFAAAAEHDISIQPLLTTVLMKGAKTKGCVIGISQADTSSAHGLKGIDAAWRIERVSVEALHEENELGERSPTGRYLVNRGSDETEEWILPEWMLTELNQWMSPDPVVWMLNWFPEICLNQKGSEGGSEGSERGSALEPLNLRTKTVQTLNPLMNLEVQDLNQNGSGFEPCPEPPLTADADTLNRIREMKDLGMNKAQIIYAVWGARKGGSKVYQEASQIYDEAINE